MLFISTKNPSGILIGIVLSLYINLGITEIRTALSPPMYEPVCLSLQMGIDLWFPRLTFCS